MDLEKFDEVQKWLRNKSRDTKAHYKTALRDYCQFTGLNPDDLIDEVAEDLEKPRRKQGEPEERLEKFLEHLNSRDLSETTIKHKMASIKSFFSKNKFPLDVKIPKATPENRELKLRKDDVKKLVDQAPTHRDRAIILMMFQSGMDVSTICALDYGDVSRGLENDEYPLPIHVKRDKAKVNYTTFIGRDGINALKTYLKHRRAKEGELKLDDPLFVKERKRGSSRMTTELIQKMIKKVAVESELVSEERMEKSKLNPARPHTLRKAFGSIMQLQGVNQDLIDGFMGHKVQYDGAYSQATEEELAEIYLDVEDELSTAKRLELEDYDEKLDVFEETIEELVHDKEELESEVSKLREELEKQRKMIEAFGSEVIENPDLLEDMRKFAEMIEIMDENPNLMEKVRERSN